MTQEEGQKKTGASTGKVIAIGCGVVLIVAIFAGWMVVKSVKKAVLGYVDDFTSTEAAELARPSGSEAEAQVVIARFDDFADALEKGEEAEALSLDANDLNQLITYHPDWKGLAGMVSVEMEGDEIGGEVSIPLGEFVKSVDALKGRYLNGAAAFNVGLTSGRLVIFLEELEVNGKAVPDSVMSSFKTQNLFEGANTNPDFEKVLNSLESITVSEGRLQVVPKPVAERPAP